MPFYKKDGEQLLVALNQVDGPGFSLSNMSHSEHTYPIEGWYWFNTLDAAMAGISSIAAGVSPRQIRQALTAAGLRTQIEAAVAVLDQDTKDWWEFATNFERQHPMVINMAALLGISTAQIDTLFLEASKL